MLVDALHAQHDVGRLEQFLLIGRGQERQRRRDEVDQAARIFDVERNGLQLIGEGGRGGDDLLELRHHVALQCFELRALAWIDLRQVIDGSCHERFELGELS